MKPYENAFDRVAFEFVVFTFLVPTTRDAAPRYQDERATTTPLLDRPKSDCAGKPFPGGTTPCV